MNQKEIQSTLTNKDEQIYPIKKSIEELFRERFDEIIELNDETTFDDLISYFKVNTVKKRFDDLKNGMKYFEKIKSKSRNMELKMQNKKK